jgi:hypothetical protein
MKEELLRQYAITIANTITDISRGFGISINQWNFMTVSEPKIPFANSEIAPDITLTFNLESDSDTKEVLRILIEILFKGNYNPAESYSGHYLICFLTD